MKIKLCGKNNMYRKILFFLIFLIFNIAFLSTVFFVLLRFRPVFEEKASYVAKNKANLVLNEAISDVFDSYDTKDMVIITEKNNMDIASISMDTAKLNKLKVKVYSKILEKIGDSNDSVVYIPVGSLTDYPVLQGIGYKIPVKIVFDTSVNIDFTDNIKEAGINQVYHEIFIVATADVDIVSSIMTTSENINVEIPISQTLIVGDVPASYGGNVITRQGAQK